jgi:hypothetical protein
MPTVIEGQLSVDWAGAIAVPGHPRGASRSAASQHRWEDHDH